MSIFVQLPPADYSRTAFGQFRPLRTGFDLGDARTMMWMSQLAYETDTPADDRGDCPAMELKADRVCKGRGAAD